MRIAVIIAPLLLVACSKVEEQPVATEHVADSQAMESPTAPETARRLTSAELAYAVGAECPTASRSQYKGKDSDQVFYAVQCGTKGYLVSVKFDGNSRVVGCALADKMGTPCWKEW